MEGLIAYVSPSNKSLYANSLPPIGLLGIASFIESKGYPVDVIDGNIQDFDPDFEKYDFFCFAVNIANVTNTFKIINDIKSNYPDKKVILGGPSTPSIGERYAKSCNADAVIVGEGEYTLLELLQSDDLSNVKGIFIKEKNGNIKFTGERKLIMNLDELPFPALDKVPLDKYNVSIKQAKPICNIITSRGCPNSCTYCFHTKAWRQRSAKNVVDEIEWQVKLGIKEIAINDDNFTLNEKRAEEICDMIIERGIKVKLQCMNGIRADRVSRELLVKMKKAGFWLVAVAPESGSQKTLELVKKKMSLETVKQVVGWCKEIGISTYSFFMIGFPWETREDIMKTINYAKDLDTDFTQFTRVSPIEGTELYEQMKEKNIAPEQGVSDEGFFFGGVKHQGFTNISPEEVSKLVKKAYRTTYLRPKKMWRILNLLSIKDIFDLAKYAIRTDSM